MVKELQAAVMELKSSKSASLYHRSSVPSTPKASSSSSSSSSCLSSSDALVIDSKESMVDDCKMVCGKESNQMPLVFFVTVIH